MEQELQRMIERYLAAFFLMNKRIRCEIREMLDEEMTISQLQILDYIVMHDKVTSTELAEAFVVGKSSITAIITRLADKGMLERVRIEDDRRMVYLSATERGIDINKWARNRIVESLSVYLGQLKEEEIRELIGVFEKIAQLMGEGSWKL